MKRIFLPVSLLALIGVGSLLVWAWNYKTPLELVELGDIYVREGERLTSVVQDLQVKIDPRWTVKLEGDVGDRVASRSFGGGGSAVIVAMIADEFRCDYVVDEDERCIVLK